MKRVLLAIASVLLLSASTGCFHNAVRSGDGACGGGGCNGLLGGLAGGRLTEAMQQTQGWRHQRPEIGPMGPPTGTTAYPYYTLHAPRDFLANNPPSLGN
jgi:hypothetical protein